MKKQTLFIILIVAAIAIVLYFIFGKKSDVRKATDTGTGIGAIAITQQQCEDMGKKWLHAKDFVFKKKENDYTGKIPTGKTNDKKRRCHTVSWKQPVIEINTKIRRCLL